MEALALVGIAVAALLVGVLIPVLTEARATLRATRRLVEGAEPKLHATLSEVQELTARLNRLVESVEPAGPRVTEIAEAAAGLTGAIERLKGGLHVASAVGPAVAAAVKAFYAARAAAAEARAEAEGDDADAPAPEKPRA